MTTEDRAHNYLAKVEPAGQGGRNDALNRAAYAVLERFELAEATFDRLLLDWAATCSPPLSEHEALTTIRSAWRAAHGKGVVGSKSRGMIFDSPQHSKRATAPSQAARAPQSDKPAAPPAKYDLAPPAELPEPLDDGARVLLRTLFATGEGVRIAQAVWSDDKDGEIPDGGGICLTREEWLRKLDDGKGDPNWIFKTSKKTGIYIAVNPYKVGCTKDPDVTDYRHALLEFDAPSGLSPEAQYDLYVKSRLPCAAIIYSGGASCHAWVKIDAKDRVEYDERVKLLHAHFAAYTPDPANKNPGRLSRLPNCERFEKRQELLAVNVGCESFSEWQAEIQADGIGEVLTVADLDSYDTANDPNTLLGQRWLCRGGSCLLIGPSGIGKSSLVLQLVIPWALGRPSFGILPVRPLKILMIQAENDTGDMAEMLRGIREGLGIDPDFDGAAYSLLKRNLVFVRETSHTGHAFTQAVRRLVDKHKPDLVVFDPLLSFIGADISRQEVCSEFLRNWLNPIAAATGVCWLCVHHTGKPPSDPKARKSWRGTDFAYAGLGSSELTNWTRAAMTLEDAGEGNYRLRLSKRGKRAGATHPDGAPTVTLWLRYADKGIFWVQQDPPQEKAPGEKGGKGGKPSVVEEINSMNTSEFIAGCYTPHQEANHALAACVKGQGGEGLNVIAKRLEAWLATKDKAVSFATCKRAIVRMVESKKLKKTSEGFYVKGDNA